jgi:hypothetical protein
MADLPSVYHINGEYYRLTDWAKEVVTYLAESDDFHVGFFSGGPESRNIQLLSEVFLSDGSGRSFADVSDGNIFSFKHLYDSRPRKALDVEIKFADKFKKDFGRVGFTPEEMDNLLLVDDVAHFVPETHNKNMAHIGMSYMFYPSLEDAKKAVVEPHLRQYIPTDLIDFSMERNKLLWQLGLIIEASEKAKREGIPLTIAYTKLTTDAAGKPLTRESIEQVQYIFKALNKLNIPEERWGKIKTLQRLKKLNTDRDRGICYILLQAILIN